MKEINEIYDDESQNIEQVSLEVITQPKFSKPEMQEARAFLRERFLHFVKCCIGKKTTLHLYENSQVSGEFRGLDVNCLDIFVSNLVTPLGKIPEAIIRATDVISFDINNIQSST